VGARFRPPMLNLLSIARFLNQFRLLCTLCRSVCNCRLTGLAILPAVAEGLPKSSGAAPNYPTVNSHKAKPIRPKSGLPTSFTLVGRMGARFDDRLQICVSGGTSMRFRMSEYGLCPRQESVLDDRREGGAEQVCVEHYRARPVAENHHSWLK
jgi:hypothetical protein